MFSLDRDYAQYHEQVYAFIYYLTFDKSLAEDLMQETFIRAYDARTSFRGQATMLTWLRKIARNLTYDYYKRQKILRFIRFTNTYEQFLPSAEELLHVQEDVRELYKALSQLKFEFRAAISLRKIEELSIKETAQVLGWSEAKVKNNTERGLRALRVLMEGEQTDE
ncbi:RNA polymerase sigma factor [Solibacillus sp. CAU 1738]|uniref:RNA polymerase sigma factor n=1 Tax=Solibacillus sp. CAU 1738 TaxID=3140363 RepID=UPI003261C531